MCWCQFGGSTWGDIFFTLGTSIMSNTPLWETHHILVQDLKVIDVWALPPINAKVSTFLTNVGLSHTTRTCYSQHSSSSLSLSITLPLKWELPLFTYTCTIVDTFQQDTFYGNFNRSKSPHSLEPKAHDTTVGENIGQLCLTRVMFHFKFTSIYLFP